MVQCKVNDRMCLVVEQGSVVLISEAQYELAKDKLEKLPQEKVIKESKGKKKDAIK